MIRFVCLMFAEAALLTFAAGPSVAIPPLNEASSAPGEWGYRPADGDVSQVTPPGFSWRPNQGIVAYEIQCARDKAFKQIVYGANDIEFNVHCPPHVLEPGAYVWRYRGKDKTGGLTDWSRPRRFTIAEDANELSLPAKEELIARVPKAHPRLFLRPENAPQLRKLAKGELKPQYDALVAQCEKLLKNPPPTAEPPKYSAGMKRGSDPWRSVWWGNRTYTIKALDGAARLAFTRMLGGKEEYGQLAKRILLDCAKWNPKGATGFRYNDEAGMPYNYYFSRTYTFLHDMLTDEERAICQRVMKIRGDEMYKFLCPRHFWRPYSSHSNRSWHFLGEVGIAFLGEVEGADDWVWFAMNVFANVYPVWSDDDGGWHEGVSYWSSYQTRFTWWADVMREATGVNAYDKPYYSKVGYYSMYLMPPGKVGGGFGDLTATKSSKSALSLNSVHAAQAGVGHWQWHVEQNGGPKPVDGYIGFIRGALPKVKAVAPDDLPASRVFHGVGQVMLNSQIVDAKQSVQVVFKSSPFGTTSHGYESSNAFLLWAYGKRLLIRSGRRDSYGSLHHKNWMWTTRSVNAITADGRGQQGHSSSAQGRVVSFETTPAMDIVVGEAADAYRERNGASWKPFMDRATRAILFVKPDLIVIYDRLQSKDDTPFEYWLHGVEKFAAPDQHTVQARNGDIVCDIDLLAPEGLTFAQTDQYDPNPRERIKLREWHLTATSPEKSRSREFVAVYRPRKKAVQPASPATLRRTNYGYELRAKVDGKTLLVQLPSDPNETISVELTGQPKLRASMK